MIELWRWYNKHIAIRILGDERVFRTQIRWVNDLPPDFVWVHNVRYVSHISEDLKNISRVYIHNRLPEYFNSPYPNCLSLDALTGEWFYVACKDVRTPIIVTAINTNKFRSLGTP